MDEAEYLSAADPRRMLAYLTGRPVPGHPDGGAWFTREAARVPLSDRKLRLWACACALTAGRNPVSVRHVSDTTDNALAWALRWAQNVPDTASDQVSPAVKAALLRDVAGNPWRPKTIHGKWAVRRQGAPFVGTAGGQDISGGHWDEFDYETPKRWLSWSGGAVVKMAQHIYDDRDFGALPVLADALEESGCEDEEILQHLRGFQRCWCSAKGSEKEWSSNVHCCHCGDRGWLPDPHRCRGDWCLDLLLGKS